MYKFHEPYKSCRQSVNNQEPIIRVMGSCNNAIPSSRILGDFPPFRLLGFGDIFRRSVIPRFRLLGFGGIFRSSVILRFRLLGFGVIFRRSVIRPFHHSTLPAFRLLGSPFRPIRMYVRMDFKIECVTC